MTYEQVINNIKTGFLILIPVLIVIGALVSISVQTLTNQPKKEGGEAYTTPEYNGNKAKE